MTSEPATTARGARRARPGAGAAVLAVIVSVLAVSGCAPPAADPPAPISTAPVRSGSAPPAAAPATPAPIAVDKVLVIMEENRSVGDVAAHLPYLMAQAHRYGYATDYHAIRHPSLPNYLSIAGGSTFGVTDDEDPAVHEIAGRSVFGALLAGGHTAMTYADGMPTTCALHDHGDYAVRHNPWTYFADPGERSACRRLDVPAGTPTRGALAADVSAGRLPTVGLLVPDVCHDGHDCSAAVTDRWLRSWLPTITAGPDFRSGRLAVVVTWDEDDDHSGNRVPLIVLHPSLTGRTVGGRLDHDALSGSLLRVAGEKPLRKGKGTPDLLEAFGLR